MPALRRPVILRCLAGLTGLILVVIGLRFLLIPEKAARFFGIMSGGSDAAHWLSYVIGLRDIWLGLLVMALAVAGDWRGMALWLGLGVFVCLGDAAIASAASGRPLSVGFHLISGVYCGALAMACWHKQRRQNAAQ